MNRGNAFTLIEMLIAVMLSAVIFIGLAAIFGTTFRIKFAGYKKGVIQGGAAISSNQLSRDIRQTTGFNSAYTPAPCSSGKCLGSASGAQCAATLVGYINLDGIPNSLTYPMAQLDQTSGKYATEYEYCIDASGDLWYTSIQFSCAPSCTPPTPPSPCGTSFSGGISVTPATLLAAGIQSESGYADCYFRRPAYVDNVVELHYSVGSGTAAVVVDSAVTAAKPVNSISP